MTNPFEPTAGMTPPVLIGPTSRHGLIHLTRLQV